MIIFIMGTAIIKITAPGVVGSLQAGFFFQSGGKCHQITFVKK